MVLVDTSSWIHILRVDGNADVRSRVETLLEAGTACWCPMVRLELWNGARSNRDKKALRDFQKHLPELAMTSEVWELAYTLAEKTRGAGATIPAADILIAACAKFYGVELEHSDSDFERLN